MTVNLIGKGDWFANVAMTIFVSLAYDTEKIYTHFIDVHKNISVTNNQVRLELLIWYKISDINLY